jgi:hypothetical protein
MREEILPCARQLAILEDDFVCMSHETKATAFLRIVVWLLFKVVAGGVTIQEFRLTLVTRLMQRKRNLRLL